MDVLLLSKSTRATGPSTRVQSKVYEHSGNLVKMSRTKTINIEKNNVARSGGHIKAPPLRGVLLCGI